jgi:hypothetical protein
MVALTTYQLLLVGVIGGLSAVVLNRALVLAWRVANRVAERLGDRRETRRTRHQDLKTCRAIDALGNTNEPTKD